MKNEPEHQEIEKEDELKIIHLPIIPLVNLQPFTEAVKKLQLEMARAFGIPKDLFDDEE